MIFFATPPGTSSQSTACSRQTTWVRLLARSRRRLDQTFSTAAWSSGLASRTPGERSAATATERASFGSFLFTFPVASSRTRAPSLGCTSSTRSPADSSCWASRCPRPPAPSTAQVRSGQAAAHSSSRSACAALARTRSSPSGSSAPLITTAVCEALCGSIPIITAVMTGLLFPVPGEDRGGHAYFQDLTALAPLLSHATARSRQASTSFESQARRAGRRLQSHARQDLSTLRPGTPTRPGRNVYPKSQVGGYFALCPRR